MKIAIHHDYNTNTLPCNISMWESKNVFSYNFWQK